MLAVSFCCSVCRGGGAGCVGTSVVSVGCWLVRIGVGIFFCRAPFLPARGGVVMSVLLGAFRFVFSFFFSSGVT